MSEALTRTGIIDFLATRFQALVFLALIVMPASALLRAQELEVSPRLTRKVPIAITVPLGVVVCSALGLLSITSAAIVVLSRCLSMKAAFGSIDWRETCGSG